MLGSRLRAYEAVGDWRQLGGGPPPQMHSTPPGQKHRPGSSSQPSSRGQESGLHPPSRNFSSQTFPGARHSYAPVLGSCVTRQCSLMLHTPSNEDPSSDTAAEGAEMTTPSIRMPQMQWRVRACNMPPNVVFSCELAWRGPCASKGRDKVDRQLQDFVGCPCFRVATRYHSTMTGWPVHILRRPGSWILWHSVVSLVCWPILA